MTDEELVAKKLALIETYVRELRTLARPDAIASDVRERRFVEHTLQIAIQSCQDVASHIVSDDRLGEPGTNQELFDLLGRAGWIEASLAADLRRAVGFRNVLVHGYAAVDPAIVRDVLVRHVDDLPRSAAACRLPRRRDADRVIAATRRAARVRARTGAA